MAKSSNRYEQIIESIFFKHYQKGAVQIYFDRNDIEEAANQLNIRLPKNLGDVIYSFRYRIQLPERITLQAQDGYEWIIRPAGKSKYHFAQVRNPTSALRFANPYLMRVRVGRHYTSS